MDKIPVFIVNGFLGCGKTTFIKEIIENDDKFTEHKVVIIQTEEGEEEYSKEWLDKYGLQLITVDDEDEIAMRFKISSIPTLLVFKNGEVVKKFVGVTGKDTILAALK